DLAIEDLALSLQLRGNAEALAVVNATAADEWVAVLADRHLGQGVAEDVALFHRPHAGRVDEDAELLAVVDATAADDGGAAFHDVDLRLGTAKQVAVLHRATALLLGGDAVETVVVN